MDFEKRYAEVSTNNEWRLKHKDIDLFVKARLIKVDSRETAYLFLLIDTDTNRTILEKIAKLFSGYDIQQKERVFNYLKPYIVNINIQVIVDFFVAEDYLVGFSFFSEFFDNIDVASVDKFILFDEILGLELNKECESTYVEKILSVSENVLGNPSSIKGEVRMAVSALRRIGKNYLGFGIALKLEKEMYIENQNWRNLYLEEVEHRHKTLMNSYGDKVSEALRKKEYSKVVGMLRKYEHELPDILRKKMDFSLKRLKNNL